MLSKKLPFAVDDFYAAASLVGDGPAGEFVAFKSIYKDIPDIDGILSNPGQSKVPESTSVLYAICGALSSRATPENFNAIVKYIKRMPPEYQVIVIRDSIAKDRSLITHEKFQKWSDDNADVLL